MMENEYLWDKKGADSEIEGLENMLCGFKYEATAPPRLPAAVVLNEDAKMPWWKLSLAFAVPACVLLTVAVGFWALQLQNGSPESVSIKETPSLAVPTEQKPKEILPDDKTKAPESEKTEVTRPLRTIYTPQTKPNSVRPIKANYRQKKQPFETLTSEERFAYDQLKLALSITGAKLKVVSDTVNRTED